MVGARDKLVTICGASAADVCDWRVNIVSGFSFLVSGWTSWFPPGPHCCIGELARAGVRIGSEEGRRPYGQIQKVKIDWKPNGLSTWAALTTTLGVNCGEDSSLYLLRRDGNAWQLRFSMESTLRGEVTNAQRDFRYVVSQADPDGRFFVFGARVNTWCTSCLRNLRYEAFTLDASGTPSKLLTKNTDIYGCNTRRTNCQFRIVCSHSNTTGWARAK